MKRMIALLMLLLIPGVAVMAQTGGGTPGQNPAWGPGMMGGGMMGPGMMGPNMMGPNMMGPNMMGPGMMGPNMMGPGMMAGGMGPAVPPCMMMSGGMGGPGMMPCAMMNQLDALELRASLGLTPEQVEKLKALLRPLQREAIRAQAGIRVAGLDVEDLLAADKVDFAKVEEKVKEQESLRTAMAMAHLRAEAEMKKILSADQMQKFRGMCAGCRMGERGPSAPPAAPPEEGHQHAP